MLAEAPYADHNNLKADQPSDQRRGMGQKLWIDKADAGQLAEGA
jgi:hypothetical protein